MRKLFDSKAGATFHQELPNTTICIRKDSVELIYKLKPAVYMIIHVVRVSSRHVLLHPPFPAWKKDLCDLWNG